MQSILQYSFQQNRFYGVWSSQRPSASVSLTEKWNILRYLTLKPGDGLTEGLKIEFLTKFSGVVSIGLVCANVFIVGR